ncbi:hypothetical protein QOM21_29605 [Streptomyces sp. Pv4-95]|uniref:hypothetical protein n=1 Tax=Streptomyces sp. Pv4-95 TaxID=3049543 RepID=UPI003892A54D
MIESSAPPESADRDEWVRIAARNNATWCDTVCRAHGISGAFDDHVWASARRTPPLYPDAVTLTPEASAAELLPRVDARSPGCSVKDSFARLDLASAGFEVLFEAQWIHRPAGAAAPAPVADVRWDVVRDEDDLAAWAAAWSGEPAAAGQDDNAQRRPDNGPFRSELLADDGTFFLRGLRGDTVVAGAVATTEGPVVGLSNVFAADDDPHGAWAGALATVASRWAGSAVVGYESGADLEAAVSHGCLPIGPLRVWWRAG